MVMPGEAGVRLLPSKGQEVCYGCRSVLCDLLKKWGHMPPLCLDCHLLPVPEGGIRSQRRAEHAAWSLEGNDDQI